MSAISHETYERLLDANHRLGGPPSEFLRFRRNQLEIMLHHARVPIGGTFLEIGGGVSGHAFLLTDVADRVVCTDLLEVGSSYGGQFADAALLRRADRRGRLHYVCARGEAIPLRDDSVDVVFSSFVFEHIAGRAEAVSEIHRVLRPGGYVVTAVPNRMEQVHRALGFYLTTVPRQLIKTGLFWSGLARRFGLGVAVPPPPRPRSFREARLWARSALTYRPHGAYSGHLRELGESGITQWDRLFERGGFTISRRFTVSLENYVSFLSSRLTYRMQERLLPLMLRFGDSAPAVMAGVSYCFVARKAPAPVEGAPALHPALR